MHASLIILAFVNALTDNSYSSMWYNTDPNPQYGLFYHIELQCFIRVIRLQLIGMELHLQKPIKCCLVLPSDLVNLPVVVFKEYQFIVMQLSPLLPHLLPLLQKL